jgi:MarR family transcriptional regulator, lower aerobic nicotinate degradation pathway regulator
MMNDIWEPIYRLSVVVVFFFVVAVVVVAAVFGRGPGGEKMREMREVADMRNVLERRGRGVGMIGAAGDDRGGREARVILDSIRRIVRALRVFDRDAERRVGLSGAQVFVLQKLRGEEVVSINELARRTHTHQSSVSGVVKKLEKRKLLRRSQGIKDGRRVEVSITGKGKKILGSAPAAAQDRLVRAIYGLSSARRMELSRSLVDLVKGTGIEDHSPSLFFEEGKRAGAKRSMKSPGQSGKK